jgi:hypothetical protein
VTHLADEQPPPRRQSPLVGLFIVILALVAMLVFTWRTWCDPVVDFGRELYVPWQLSQGKVLYRDIAHFNGPVSAYFNSLIFRIFGVSLMSIVWTNIVILLAMLIVLYRTLCAIADQFAATTACVAVTILLATGQPGPAANYNFICPYAHELTHGVALSIAMIASLYRFDRTRKMPWIALSGLLLGLVLLTKVEVSLSALLTALVTFSLLLRRGENRIAVACVFAMSAILPIIIAVLSCYGGFSTVFGAWRWSLNPQLSALPFYQRVRGTLDLRDSLSRLSIVSVGWCAVIGIGVAAAYVARRTPKPVGLIASFVLIAAGLSWGWNDVPWQDVGRPLILTTVAIAAFVLVRGKTTPENRLRVGLALFALMLLAKIFLQVQLYHYGFALALPALALTIVVGSCWIPGWLNRTGRCGAFVRGAVLGALAVTCARYVAYMQQRYVEKTVLVGSGADAFWTPERGRSVNALLDLISRLPPGKTVAVLPEGVMINYLSRRQNPTPYIVVMPPEAIMFGQANIARAFEDHPPDYIAVLGANPIEYGYRTLPQYLPDLTSWIDRNYETVQTNLDPAMQWMLRRHR